MGSCERASCLSMNASEGGAFGFAKLWFAGAFRPSLLRARPKLRITGRMGPGRREPHSRSPTEFRGASVAGIPTDPRFRGIPGSPLVHRTAVLGEGNSGNSAAFSGSPVAFCWFPSGELAAESRMSGELGNATFSIGSPLVPRIPALIEYLAPRARSDFGRSTGRRW